MAMDSQYSLSVFSGGRNDSVVSGDDVVHVQSDGSIGKVGSTPPNLPGSATHLTQHDESDRRDILSPGQVAQGLPDVPKSSWQSPV